MTDVADVVVVGGGIAGAPLAYALADAGARCHRPRGDRRVRGPGARRGNAAVGVKEARELAVEPVMLDAAGPAQRRDQGLLARSETPTF